MVVRTALIHLVRPVITMGTAGARIVSARPVAAMASLPERTLLEPAGQHTATAAQRRAAATRLVRFAVTEGGSATIHSIKRLLLRTTERKGRVTWPE